MTPRTRAIVKTLGTSFLCALLITTVKLIYGKNTDSLAFIADGFHSLLDATATLLGLFSVIWSSQPPDEAHPYGHQKFETLSAIVLSLFLLVAAYEVGTLAYDRFLSPAIIPPFSFWGIVLLASSGALSLSVAALERSVAKNTASPFLFSDAAHNQSDVWISIAVGMTLISSYFKIPYIDAVVAAFITVYLFYISVRIIIQNINPLVDHSVLDSRRVEEITSSVKGVLHCHAIRSRGHRGHLFLDLNIHLPGHITLYKAHEITHNVESLLKKEFPGLVDVIIHTEPHNHPPCSKDE